MSYVRRQLVTGEDLAGQGLPPEIQSRIQRADALERRRRPKGRISLGRPVEIDLTMDLAAGRTLDPGKVRQCKFQLFRNYE